MLLPQHDFVATYRNPQATSDLVVPIQLTCNVSDATLIRNIRANSLCSNAWLYQHAENDKPAVIVGSGPSVKQEVDFIDALHKKGAVIFALNGVASFLAGKGIWADYQVIADARPETANLIGPAKNYLFASQVDPSLLKEKPNAILFHADYGGVQALIPERDADYVLIGSHATVGNTSLAIAYALGHREIIVFGFDSSNNRGESHVVHQSMNENEPMIVTEWNGRGYVSSYSMKQQANVFPRIATELEQMGCKISVQGFGLLPEKWNAEKAKTIEQREADKYAEMWKHDEYRVNSPAVNHVVDAVLELEIEAGDSLIDFGCGTGRATKVLIDQGVKASGVDIAPNALEFDIPFTQTCLWQLPEMEADFGLCCDVMEHIPTEKVDDVLAGIARSVTRGAYFTIDNDLDQMGVLIGAMLHLTRQPVDWWMGKLGAHFEHVTFKAPNIYVCTKAEDDGW